jgi:hypothetical protein
VKRVPMPLLAAAFERVPDRLQARRRLVLGVDHPSHVVGVDLRRGVRVAEHGHHGARCARTCECRRRRCGIADGVRMDGDPEGTLRVPG